MWGRGAAVARNPPTRVCPVTSVHGAPAGGRARRASRPLNSPGAQALSFLPESPQDMPAVHRTHGARPSSEQEPQHLLTPSSLPVRPPLRFSPRATHLPRRHRSSGPASPGRAGSKAPGEKPDVRPALVCPVPSHSGLGVPLCWHHFPNPEAGPPASAPSFLHGPCPRKCRLPGERPGGWPAHGPQGFTH